MTLFFPSVSRSEEAEKENLVVDGALALDLLPHFPSPLVLPMEILLFFFIFLGLILFSSLRQDQESNLII